MYPILILCWQYFRAFAIIYLCLYAGNFMASLLPVTIPGSILGMLLLFMLLVSHIISVDWIQPGCQLLIRYMTILFVPISVGIMQYYDVLISQFGSIVISSLLSSFITLIIIAYAANWLYRHEEQ